ncbi:MAG: rRNA maturation RNase YbeY [Thiobacillaceae bacterium]
MPTRVQFRRWAQKALQEAATVTLRIVDCEEAQRLNRDYRGKDYATNVLTFAYGKDAVDPTIARSGDIVLCAPVVEREALEQGKDLVSHYAHLTVHGMLHLQGYDHETDDAATIMETLEAGILAKLGFRDPYNEVSVLHGVRQSP